MAQKGSGIAGILLQISVGVFFAISGIQGIVYADSTLGRIVSGVQGLFGRDSTLNVIISVVLLVAGILLIVGLFLSLKRNVQVTIGIILMALWGLNMINVYLLGGIAEPNLLTWLKALAGDLIILVALWIIADRKQA